MDIKFRVIYTEDQDIVLVKDISLFPGKFVEPLECNKSIYLRQGILFYDFSTMLRTGETYRSSTFHARTRFIINLLKKWSLPVKKKDISIEVIKTSKVEAKPKVKLKHSPLGIQVDVIRFSKADLYLVTRVQALHLSKLPCIYTEQVGLSLPRVWQHTDKLLANNGQVLLHVGETYSYGQLKKALLYIELAGRHLEAANKHMKPNRPKWATSNVISFKDGLLLKDTTFQNHNEVDLGT